MSIDNDWWCVIDESSWARKVNKLEFRDVEEACMPSGPSGCLNALLVKKVVDLGHGGGTSYKGSVVDVAGRVVVFVGLGESEKVGSIEEVEDRGEGRSLGEAMAGGDGWRGKVVKVQSGGAVS